MTKSIELNQHLFPQVFASDDLITIYNTAKNLTATGAAFPDEYGTDFYWPHDNMSVDPDGFTGLITSSKLLNIWTASSPCMPSF